MVGSRVDRGGGGPACGGLGMGRCGGVQGGGVGSGRDPEVGG